MLSIEELLKQKTAAQTEGEATKKELPCSEFSQQEALKVFLLLCFKSFPSLPYNQTEQQKALAIANWLGPFSLPPVLTHFPVPIHRTDYLERVEAILDLPRICFWPIYREAFFIHESVNTFPHLRINHATN